MPKTDSKSKHIGKPTNPKDAIADTRLPLGSVSAIAQAFNCIGLSEGKYKYGGHNYREYGVRASVYMNAISRHMSKWYDEGEWADPVTKVPHLASAMANISIIIDAIYLNKLTDDRPPSMPVSKAINELEHVLHHLQEMFKDRKPKHHTIKNKNKK